MRKTSLRELLKRVAGGDEEAFRLLYEQTSPKLFGLAVRILKRSDLAEDAVQDTYLKIWNGVATYRPGYGSAFAWLATITRNRAIDMLRKRTESSIDDDPGFDMIDEDLPDPFHQAVHNRDLRRFLACLEKLDREYQRCLLMAYYYGYTHEEIAARLPAPVGTVKSRIRRGLAQVRECLSDG
ncbi:MAG: sigma-70 family RNA polymerase sigma factor [Alphaproteobacteria bacterium]|nr:MAG: sigma-70 family RNA polymerase sigma factor [Alphaproteobacteria bacterium]